MHYVYILTSVAYPERYYIGLTDNIKERLVKHNNGDSAYTKKYAPWKINTYIALENRMKASELEKYLKSGSGFSFLKKRLI